MELSPSFAIDELSGGTGFRFGILLRGILVFYCKFVIRLVAFLRVIHLFRLASRAVISSSAAEGAT